MRYGEVVDPAAKTGVIMAEVILPIMNKFFCSLLIFHVLRAGNARPGCFFYRDLLLNGG